MKAILALSALAAFGMTGAAAAQSGTDVGGTADAYCSLPTAFAFHSSTAGTGAGNFTGGSTWNIPPAQLASANGTAVTNSPLAIRIRGAGNCNTSHSITLTSLRGGLTAAGDASAAAPAGFAKRRPIHYEAYWVASGSSSSTVPLGPQASLVADIPGESASVNYVVSASLPPPGPRSFDIRMGMDRPAMATPLLAGAYSDTVTVTLSIQ